MRRMAMPLEKHKRSGRRTVNHVRAACLDVFRTRPDVCGHKPHEHVVAMELRASLNVGQIEPHFDPRPVEAGQHAADEPEDVISQPGPRTTGGFQLQVVETAVDLVLRPTGGRVKPHLSDTTSGNDLCTVDGHWPADQHNVGVGGVNAGDLIVVPSCGPPHPLRDLHVLTFPGSSVVHQATR